MSEKRNWIVSLKGRPVASFDTIVKCNEYVKAHGGTVDEVIFNPPPHSIWLVKMQADHSDGGNRICCHCQSVAHSVTKEKLFPYEGYIAVYVEAQDGYQAQRKAKKILLDTLIAQGERDNQRDQRRGVVIT